MARSLGAKLEQTSHVIRTNIFYFVVLLATCAFSIHLHRSVDFGSYNIDAVHPQQETSAPDIVPANDPATLSNLSQSRNGNTATTTTTKVEPIIPRLLSDKVGVDSGEIQNVNSNSNSKTRAPQVFGITYGTAPFEKALNRLKQEADDSKLFQSFEICRNTDLDASFVDHFRDVLELERGGGYWIWKVPLIQRHLERLEYGDILVYLDAGDRVRTNGANRFWWYVEQMQRTNTSIVAFEMPQRVEQVWTTNALFDYFKIAPKTPLWKKVAKSGQYIASILIMRKTPELESIMALYNQTLYDDPYLFTDKYNDATKQKRGNFLDNRHDQSVFSVVRKLFPNDTFVIPDETFKPKTAVPFVTERSRGFSRRKIRLEKLASERLGGLLISPALERERLKGL
jgi:hypothetical protein